MARLGEGQTSTFKEATWVKASPTLFITNIPPGEAHLDLLEKTLRAQPGFIPPMRIAKGGAIAFGDYETAQQATDCMLNLLGLVFPGWSGGGLKISYDKDDSEEKRKERHERKVKDEAHKMCQRLACKICKTFCLKISKQLDKMPRRGTDQSHVIDEEKHLVELNARKGDVKFIQRDKGVEQQCRLMCENCGCLLAYRPKPVGETCKYMYVLAEVTTPTDSEAPAHSGPRGAWPGSADDEAREGDWACPTCSAACYAKRTECFKCGSKRPGGAPSLSCAHQLAKYQTKDGEWTCPKCGTCGNFSSRSNCFKCRAPRPGAAAANAGGLGGLGGGVGGVGGAALPLPGPRPGQIYKKPKLC